ncbi:hypothetical protein GA0074695_0740 [Micromonospora viridifaciens]|uniref:Uncharacterized protein n=1 Tax=Micromonospora viridifaciens TaxID=1881 RepID=A0A1C4UR36_MICVI|nr:hypothetical protein GA0074695_0740 [Micromonospora viridifaciens]
MPRLLVGLVDDAAVFPPGSASLPDAVAAHRRHRAAWYADLVGPLLLPASALPEVPGLLAPDAATAVGVIGDVPIGRLEAVLAQVDRRLGVRQVEAAVAKRGEDPQPGLADLLKLAERLGGTPVYAEIPLTFGLMGALDSLAEARAGGLPIAAKFRTGGLAAELFPAPGELAAVICACRDRQLPFKLTAGLHHALRHRDPETGFTHHGFVNVLAATLAAAGGVELDAVADLLAATDAVRVVELVRAHRDAERPLWVGYGSCSISEPLTDLIRLGLMNGGYEA